MLHSVAQVLLQPRGLLLMRGDAYNRLLHSIPSQAADSVSSLCANTHLAKEVTEVRGLSQGGFPLLRTPLPCPPLHTSTTARSFGDLPLSSTHRCRPSLDAPSTRDEAHGSRFNPASFPTLAFLSF